MSGETRALSRGRRMFRIPTLLRRVLRWIPREEAARPRLPEERRTAPTMYFFSNSFFARSSEIPCERSASMICWSCPSRFKGSSEKFFSEREVAHLSKLETRAIAKRKEIQKDFSCQPDEISSRGGGGVRGGEKGGGRAGRRALARAELFQLDFVSHFDQPGRVGQPDDRPTISHRQDGGLAEIRPGDEDARRRRQVHPVSADRPDSVFAARGIAKHRQEVARLESVGGAEIHPYRGVRSGGHHRVPRVDDAALRLSGGRVARLGRRRLPRERDGNRLEHLQAPDKRARR